MNVDELRGAERFIAVGPLSATFAAIPIDIVDLSTIGAQIEHAVPIRLGTIARFMIRRRDVAIDVKALLIWSRLSEKLGADGKYLYRSGLRIESGNAEYALGLHMLIKAGAMKREFDTLERKRRRLIERLAEKNRPMRLVFTGSKEEVPADQLLLVQHARERLLSNPDEAQKWYQRAKYAITHGASNVEIGSITSNREEVLAVWEYLERSIDVQTISRAFDKMREPE